MTRQRCGTIASYVFIACSILVLSGQAPAAWNNPYPASDKHANILYSFFRERPKTLDPARAYSFNEYTIIGQIYEPPFQYHYLKRPYTLVPLTATAVPHPTYYDDNGKQLAADARVVDISQSVYEIRIRPGIYYQPHPCFARDDNGNHLYHDLTSAQLRDHRRIDDFSQSGTRELVAADYIYQIKRLAHPALHSPILSLMSEYIAGMGEYAQELQKAYDQLAEKGEAPTYLDLTRYPLTGVEQVDRYTYRVKIRGKYPQFRYWMAMPFFAPMPPEADRFFSQLGMADQNLTLEWYPVGTGPYMLTVNNPNLQMVLERNPRFHDEHYPNEGKEGDVAKGLLADAGKRLPFVDKAIFSLEKEAIPRWNKYLQGYSDLQGYWDRTGVPAAGFDQTIQMTAGGDTELTPEMQAKGIRLLTSVAPSTYYLGFNMLDPVVGGYSERSRKLRQALSIAIEYEQEILIFRNGRGIPAQGPLAPGIFGYRAGCAGRNTYVYDCVDGRLKRKPIEVARRLLEEAGYPNGRDSVTGKPLLLYFDTALAGPDAKAHLDWMRKQFQKLNIQLVARATDYNRFQEKMLKGNAQIFRWGWGADYPDPENFLFLLYGPNRQVGNAGENAANYENAEFDRLFVQMKDMDNGPARARVIDRMLKIVRHDAPWVWGLHPKEFILHNAWVHNVEPNHMANNTLKYLRLDPALRAERREEWNKPAFWPIGLLGIVLAITAVPAVVSYMRKEGQ